VASVALRLRVIGGKGSAPHGLSRRQKSQGGSGWEGEASVWQRVYQAVGYEAVQGAGALDVVGPDGV
jgi:hypothetical protein